MEFNALAANLYRDGHDSIGWHSDDEKIFGQTPIIASLSFGNERVFELRKKPPAVTITAASFNFSCGCIFIVHNSILKKYDKEKVSKKSIYEMIKNLTDKKFTNSTVVSILNNKLASLLC